MSSDKGYNGWSSYETWATALHLDNDEYSYNHWRDRAREALLEQEADIDNAVTQLEDELEDHHRDEMHDMLERIPMCWIHAVLGGAFSDIDFREIARHYVEDVTGEFRKEQLDLISQGLDPDDWDSPMEDDE